MEEKICICNVIYRKINSKSRLLQKSMREKNKITLNFCREALEVLNRYVVSFGFSFCVWDFLGFGVGLCVVFSVFFSLFLI